MRGSIKNCINCMHDFNIQYKMTTAALFIIRDQI